MKEAAKRLSEAKIAAVEKAKQEASSKSPQAVRFIEYMSACSMCDDFFETGSIYRDFRGIA